MSKANKKIIAILVGVAAAYTTASWYIGKQIESGIQTTVSDANKRYSSQTFSGLKEDNNHLLSLVEYKRGIFSSNAKYNVNAVTTTGEHIQYQLISDISHGFFPKAAISNGVYSPLLAYADTVFNIPQHIADKINLKNINQVASATTKVGFDGDSNTILDLVKLSIDLEDDATYDFSGGKFIIDISNNQSNADVVGNFDYYSIKQVTNNETIDIKDISINSQIELQENGNKQNTTVLLKSLDISSLDGSFQTIANDISINIDSKQENEILDAAVTYRIPDLSIDNRNVGKFDFGFKLDSFNLPALIEISQEYMQILDKYGANSIGSIALNPQDQEQWLSKFKPFLAAKPSLTIEPISWGNDAGSSQAFLQISLTDPQGPSSDTIDIEKIVDDANLKIEISKAMIMELFTALAEGSDGSEGADEVGAMLFDQYANLLADQGLAVLDGDKLSISVNVNPTNDQASINDKVMTLNEFFMLAFGLMMFL